MSTFLSPPQYNAEIAKESGTTGIAVAALNTLAAIVGLAPVAMYFKRPWYLLAFAGVAALMALSSRRKHVQAGDEHHPGPLHYAAAALTAICFWGLVGFMWYGLYVLFFWVFRLVGLLIESINADTWGFYASLVCAGFVGLGIAISSAQSMSRLIHTEGIHSIRGRKAFLYWVALLLAVAVVSAAGLWYCSGGYRGGIFLGVQFVLYLLGLPALSIEKGVGKQNESAEAVCKLFESAGYTVTRSPRSADSLINTVLSKLDLIAISDRHIFAVEIKTAADSTKPVDWSTASSLRSRVKTLEYSYYEHLADTKEEGPDLRGRPIKPLMVLVGREQDESFVAFSQKASLSVVKLDAQIVQLVMATNDPEKLKEIARHYLQGIDTTQVIASSAT